jgi:mannose-6-phosphate isomerase-like protein (cupin superfamily)
MSQDRALDFGPVGMWWEITRSTADTGGELFEAVNVLAPDFAGPPLHIHPTAEESYPVVSGTLDVCVGGEWRRLAAGESATVPAGTPHTLRNGSGAEVRLVNVHRPALGFERFFRRLHALACSRGVSLPPRGLPLQLVAAVVEVGIAAGRHQVEQLGKAALRGVGVWVSGVSHGLLLRLSCRPLPKRPFCGSAKAASVRGGQAKGRGSRRETALAA